MCSRNTFTDRESASFYAPLKEARRAGLRHGRFKGCRRYQAPASCRTTQGRRKSSQVSKATGLSVSHRAPRFENYRPRFQGGLRSTPGTTLTWMPVIPDSSETRLRRGVGARTPEARKGASKKRMGSADHRKMVECQDDENPTFGWDGFVRREKDESWLRFVSLRGVKTPREDKGA